MDARKPYRNLQVFADVSNTLQPSHATAAGLNNKPSTQQQKPKPCISVTSSGFRSAAKQQIQQLASQFGAKYSGELVQGCTTHLVCKRLIDCFATPKYQCALEWGIHIVSYDWLLASAAAGHAVPEQDYKDDGLDALKPSPAPPPRQRQQQQQHQQQQAECLQMQAQPPQHQHSLQERCEDLHHQQEQLQHQQQGTPHAQLHAHQQQEQRHEQDSPAQRAEQYQPVCRTRDACAAGAHSSSGNDTAGTGQLFTFAAEIPANFLLLGPDSPCSAGAEHGPCSPSKFSCSQYRQDHHQWPGIDAQQVMQKLQQEALVLNGAQQEREQREEEMHQVSGAQQEQQHALCAPEASEAEAGAVPEPGFQFCSGASTPPQHTSPCMQSFLPMQQAQQLPSTGSFSLQQQQQQQVVDNPLAGSELQPNGVLDLPAAPGDAAAAAAAAADGPAATAAEAGHGQQQQQQLQQQRPLLIPETQYEDFSFLGRPCGTPDSLAHYGSKQRRRQKAAQAAAGHAEQQQPRQQQHKDTTAGAAVDGAQAQAGCEAQWPPSWLQTAAAAARNKQQGLQQQHAPADSRTGQPPPAAAAAAAGDCAPPSAGLVRLRRRAAVADASPPGPADLAELEDSDCELEGSAAAGTAAAAATAAAYATDGRTSSADLTELEDSDCELDGLAATAAAAAATATAAGMATACAADERASPADLAELEDSDCELARSPAAADAAAAAAAGQGIRLLGDPDLEDSGCELERPAAAEAAERQGFEGLDGDSGSDCELADSDSSLNVGSDMPGNTSDLLCDSYDDVSDTASSSSSPTSGHKQQRVHGRDRGRHPSAAATAATAAGMLSVAFAEQRFDVRKQETPSAGHGRQVRGGQCSSPHSCSGSSLPSGTRPYSAAEASATASAAAADSGDGAYYSATDVTADSAGTSAAAAAAAADTMGMTKQSGGQSGVTGEGSQSHMPVMRLTFSLGGCSMGSGWEGMPGQPQQQQEEEEEGQAYAEGWGGEEQGFDSQREEGGKDSEGVLSDASHDDTQCTADEDAAFGSVQGGGLDADATSTATSSGSGVNGNNSSRRSTGSSGRLRLWPGSAAAGAATATAAAGTAATAAALMQKRQVLKQQQQRGDSMLAASGRHGFVTPPSEGSMFVTRRKCPRPTAGASTASTAAAAAGQESAQQPFYLAEPVEGPGGSLLAAAEAAAAAGTAAGAAADTSGSEAGSDSDSDSEVGQGGRVARRTAAAAAAAAAADIPDSEEWDGEEEWESSTGGRRGAAAAAIGAHVAPAEQFLKDLKQKKQQKHVEKSGCRWSKIAVPKLKQQQQQQQNPAEAFLRDLKDQQQQKQQQPGSMLAFGSNSSSAAAAAAGGAQLPRHSVSSSCTGTELSTALHKVPLQLQGGGIVLQGCITTSSTCMSATASSTEDGLSKALQKALAAARPAAGAARPAAVGACQADSFEPHDRRQQQQQPGRALVATGVGGDISPVFLGLQQQQQQQQQQHFEDGDQEAAGGAVAWLHTPEDTQQKQQQRQEQLDLVGMPTVGVAARGAAVSKHLGARLAQLSQTQEEVVPLKLLQKAPRGSTAKAYHGLKSSSKLTYADQVQVPWAHATLSTKERSRCVIVAGDSSSSSSSTAAFIGEPVAFYRLPSGDWWVELLRFYSAKDLRELAKSAGQAVHLPPDFQLSYELLRGMQHEHWPMRQVQGEFKLSKVRKAPTGNRSRAQSPFFWRYSVDTATCQLLTDRPVTDFVVQ